MAVASGGLPAGMQALTKPFAVGDLTGRVRALPGPNPADG